MKQMYGQIDRQRERDIFSGSGLKVHILNMLIEQPCTVHVSHTVPPPTVRYTHNTPAAHRNQTSRTNNETTECRTHAASNGICFN
jgi:hypothetical protein